MSLVSLLSLSEGVSGAGGLGSPDYGGLVALSSTVSPPWEPRTSFFHDAVVFEMGSWRKVLDGINVWCGENPLEVKI